MGTHPIFESDFDCLTERRIMSGINLDNLSADQMLAGASALQGDAKDYSNTQDVEAAWAARAFQQAEIHMKLLTAVGPERMKFTQIDQELYDSFRENFPDFNIETVDEESMKNKEGKEKWRNWCEQYKERVQDYNFGTLLRLDPADDYTEKNSCFALRVQFLAIEIARNKERIKRLSKPPKLPRKLQQKQLLQEKWAAVAAN